jgi:hypothetical protein
MFRIQSALLISAIDVIKYYIYRADWILNMRDLMITDKNNWTMTPSYLLEN